MIWGELGALPLEISLLRGCSEVIWRVGNGGLGLLLQNAALAINLPMRR